MPYRFIFALMLGLMALRLPAQDRLLLQAEALRAGMHSLEQALVRGEDSTLRTQLDAKSQELQALWRKEEKQLASNAVVRGPKVKAPDGALDLLRHERHAMLDYFVGDKMLHAFVITRKATHYFVVPLPSDFDQQVSDFLCQISKPGKPSDAASFLQKATALYAILIAPLKDQLTEIDQLTIIPDPTLRFFPFEVLCQPSSEASPGFQTLPYLLRDFGIGYAFSIGHLVQTKGQKQPRKEAISVVQMFSSVNDPLTSMEADKLGNHWQVNPCCRKHLSPEAFAEAPTSVVHLRYPHAPEAMAELPDAKFDGALVNVPSAQVMGCLTANNAPTRALLMSLEMARASSISTKLWEGPPTIHNAILGKFYCGLSERQYVDQALRFARLDYLEEALPQEAHPYYWAGYMQFNDFSPVAELPRFPWYLVLIAGLLLIVVFGKKL